MSTLVRYVRDENRNPVGVVVALDANRVGYSLWDENKRTHVEQKFPWDKSRGLRIATRRAEAPVNWEQVLAEKLGMDEHDFGNMACWFENTKVFDVKQFEEYYPDLAGDRRLLKLAMALYTVYKVKRAALKFFAKGRQIA